MRRYGYDEYLSRDLTRISVRYDHQNRHLTLIVRDVLLSETFLQEFTKLQFRIMSLNLKNRPPIQSITWQWENRHACHLGLDLGYIYQAVKQHKENDIEVYFYHVADMHMLMHQMNKMGVVTQSMLQGACSDMGLDFSLSTQVVQTDHCQLIESKSTFNDISQLILHPDSDVKGFAADLSQDKVQIATPANDIDWDHALNIINQKMNTIGQLTGKDLDDIKQFIATHPRLYRLG